MIADRKAQADAVSARVDLTLETDCHRKRTEVHGGLFREEGIAGGIRNRRVCLSRDRLQPVRAVRFRQHGHHLPQNFAKSGIFLKALRRPERRIVHIHAEQKSLHSCKGLANIVKAERRIAHRVIVPDGINQPRRAVAVGRTLRNKERPAAPCVFVANFLKLRHVNVRAVGVDRRCAEIPDLVHPGDRPSCGIASRRAALVQPAIDRHRQGINRFSCLGHCVDKTCHMIRGEDLFCRAAENLCPASILPPMHYRAPDLLRHRPGVAAHIGGKICRNLRGKKRICSIGDLPRCAEQAGLILHLHRSHRLPFSVVVPEEPHPCRESAGICLHRLLSQIGERGIRRLDRDRGRNLPPRLILPFFNLCAGKPHKICFDIGRCIHALRVLPAPEPEKHDMHVPFPCLINQGLRHREIKVPLLRLDHFPCDREQQRVHPELVGDSPDLLHVGRRRRIGIMHLARQEDKRLVPDHQNRLAVDLTDMRYSVLTHKTFCPPILIYSRAATPATPFSASRATQTGPFPARPQRPACRQNPFCSPH